MSLFDLLSYFCLSFSLSIYCYKINPNFLNAVKIKEMTLLPKCVKNRHNVVFLWLESLYTITKKLNIEFYELLKCLEIHTDYLH